MHISWLPISIKVKGYFIITRGFVVDNLRHDVLVLFFFDMRRHGIMLHRILSVTTMLCANWTQNNKIVR
jgi:hypothetical protein